MSNGTWTYPVVDTEIVDRPRGRMARVVVAAHLDGEEVRRASPIVVGPLHKFDDEQELRDRIDRDVRLRRRQLRDRHEGDAEAEARARSVLGDVEREMGPEGAAGGTADASGGGGS